MTEEHNHSFSESGIKLRILIAEDYEDSAESIALLLIMRGFEVDIVKNGAAALAKIQTGSYHIVLLDIGLPKLNGWEVAKQIRAQPKLARPFLIAMTGYGSQEDRRRSAEAGIDLHLTKPIKFEELENLLTKFQAYQTRVQQEAQR